MKDNITFMLHELVWRMDGLANQMLKQHFDITFRKFYVLAVLASVEPTNQANLAGCLSYSPAAVSKSLAALSADGLVKIENDPAHARKNLVTLTPAGQKMVAQCSTFLEQAFRTLLDQSGVESGMYQEKTKAVLGLLRNST